MSAVATPIGKILGTKDALGGGRNSSLVHYASVWVKLGGCTKSVLYYRRMRPAMYSFINRGLGMTPGKIAAQAQHAAVEAYRISASDLLAKWYLGGHYCKLVMVAEDDVHLLTIQKYIEERGFKTKLIIDEGRTEIRPLSVTALGVEIVDRDDPHTAATFETFKLYKENPRVKHSLEEATGQYTEP